MAYEEERMKGREGGKDGGEEEREGGTIAGFYINCLYAPSPYFHTNITQHTCAPVVKATSMILSWQR